MSLPVFFVVGPTAVGKTAFAIDLAQAVDGEIIVMDSMQIYRGMDIVTAKPTASQQALVKHHLLDVVSPGEWFDVARYRDMAYAAMEDIKKRGRTAIFCGGTGLYLKAVVDGLCDCCGRDAGVRESLAQEEEHVGLEGLYERLVAVDPMSAQRISANDRQRIVRALEVYTVTGTPISTLQVDKSQIATFDYKILGLAIDRKELYGRINTRVDEMFEGGMIDEYKKVQELLKEDSGTAFQAMGYKHIQEYCDGTISLSETKRLIKRDTRRYAKRQLTWFRKDERIEWIMV